MQVSGFARSFGWSRGFDVAGAHERGLPVDALAELKARAATWGRMPGSSSTPTGAGKHRAWVLGITQLPDTYMTKIVVSVATGDQPVES